MNGGFFDLMRKLRSVVNAKFCEGDAIKWDSSCSRMMLEICKRLRYECWDKEGMSADEWWERMNYYYDQIISSCIILPTGQIVQKMMGQPSGTVNTTDDNCIMHLFIWCYMWRLKFSKSLFDDFGSKIYLSLYADDHIFSIDPKLNVHPYEERQPYYDLFGVGLDKDKDFVSDSPEGHTFLGLKARWVPEYKNYVPIFDANKILNILGKQESKRPDLEAVWCRAISVALASAYDPDTHNCVRSYLEFLRRSEPHFSGKIVPSTDWFRAKWTNLE
jgi:hypothetical protein